MAITGASGFIGRAVVSAIERSNLVSRIGELRLNDLRPCGHPTATIVEGSFAEADVRAQLIGDGVDILFHLASLPGGASAADPALGRIVNLDGSLALIDAVADAANPPIVVYTSSIAVLGGVAKARIDRDTALRPVGSYGTHKAMMEYYIADLSHRGVIDGRSVRPAGIVARPQSAYGGFATAWMSEMFRGPVSGRDVTVPWRGTGHVWLQSVGAVADAIVHAATLTANNLSHERVWTLPATIAHLEPLATAILSRTGAKCRIDFGTAEVDQPPLDASDSLALGFRSDGDIEALVTAVLAQLQQEALADSHNIP